MLDNALIDLFATQLEAASAQAGWNYVVLQKDQPTQEGIPTAPTIFFEKLFDHAYGWPEVTYDQYDPATNTFVQTESQWTETTFQVSALVPQDPTNLSLPTAADVVNYMKLFINSRRTIATLIGQGVSSLRVGEIRNPYFRDERHLFEANANFDVVLQHKRTITFSVGATNVVVGKTVVGISGAGVFPVLP
jgi:hypothetical protein